LRQQLENLQAELGSAGPNLAALFPSTDSILFCFSESARGAFPSISDNQGILEQSHLSHQLQRFRSAPGNGALILLRVLEDVAAIYPSGGRIR
jgi:hypothetical protein